MTKQANNGSVMPLSAWLLVFCGVALIVAGWFVPSRFNSIPASVVREAGEAGPTVTELARVELRDGNLGAATLLARAANSVGEEQASVAQAQLDIQKERNPQIARWGAWDPFLDAALGELPLEEYPDQPGLLGILIAQSSRERVAALLENSRNPLVQDILSTGAMTTYQRLFPVTSSSGRPLEVTLHALALLAQGEHLSEGLKADLRDLIWQAQADGAVGRLEDVYLDTLSLMRLFNWGQLKEVVGAVESVDSLKKLRYLLHRRSEDRDLIYALTLAGEPPAEFFDYLASYGDEGFEALERALGFGVEGVRLALREQLPIESTKPAMKVTWLENAQDQLSAFSLKNPAWSLIAKYSAFFVGSFFVLWGGSRFGRVYREHISPFLALTQRLFGATAAVVVFGILSEPYLARANDYQGYSFRFVMPVLAQVDGELVYVETTPITSMETATLLSIAVFFLLQLLVFLICLLKVREIDKAEADELVKLKLMENEENLFDSGLYVGIAGTCIALVMQVLNLVEANLLAAYSSNLFGILCVAIVKIRLVRPYKTRLIMASQGRIADLAARIA